MDCTRCDGDTRVIDTRPSMGTERRRRECKVCGHRFTTMEVVVSEPDKRAHQMSGKLQQQLGAVDNTLKRVVSRMRALEEELVAASNEHEQNGGLLG